MSGGRAHFRALRGKGRGRNFFSPIRHIRIGGLVLCELASMDYQLSQQTRDAKNDVLYQLSQTTMSLRLAGGVHIHRILIHTRGRHPRKGIQGYSLLPEKALKR